MIVDRCVCHDVTYATLREYAERSGCGFEGLRRKFGCSTSCGMCRPYIKLMLETGQIRFDAERYRFLDAT